MENGGVINVSINTTLINVDQALFFNNVYLINAGSFLSKDYYYSFINFQVCTVTAAAAAKSLQSCPTLCNPIDGSPPGSTIPGILQERTLEWVAISFSNA